MHGPVCLTNNRGMGEMRRRRRRRASTTNGGKSQQGRRSISNETRETAERHHGRLATSASQLLYMYSMSIAPVYRPAYISSISLSLWWVKNKNKTLARLSIHATLRERQQRSFFFLASFLDIPAVRDYTHIRLFFVSARLAVVERQPAISQQILFFLLRYFFRDFNHFSAFTISNAMRQSNV